MPEPTPQEHVPGLSKWSDLGYNTLDALYLRPVRWFHRNFVERFRGPAYPYYHRKFGDVKTIDECEIQDQTCFYEAEMAYLREKRIDTMIVEILHDRLTRCVVYEGRIDALDKCAKEKDALFESHTNWYQKYGEMGVPHSCIDAYMKQKHLMIWMRRHPEVDLKGWATEREYEQYIFRLVLAFLRLLLSFFLYKHILSVDQMKTIDRFDLFTVVLNILISIVGGLLVNHLIPILKEKFIRAQLWGYDLNKRNAREIQIAESQGVIAAGIFLISMFIMIAVVFSEHLHPQSAFPHTKFVEYLAALLSICCMVLLGFADDVLDLRWSVKLLLPLIASLPLLLVYFANFHSTTIILPKPVRSILGYQWNLGVLYYVYMSMVAVFCTNAINILAGVNGIEVGQSIVIAISILLFNLIELQGSCSEEHLFSLYFMIPFIGCTFPVLYRNWYPAEIFVGDTLCYFSGMTFAVVGIVGHFSKTMLLFFIPQILNFLLSIPQLFHFIPCPRHRLPRLNADLNKLNPSEIQFKKKDLKTLGWIMLRFFSATKFIRFREIQMPDNEVIISTTNFTIINTVLCWCGPLHEATLTQILIGIQIVLGTLLTFFIRYYLVQFFYDS